MTTFLAETIAYASDFSRLNPRVRSLNGVDISGVTPY